ncbi:MAG: pantoate--beta-alanine ligase [Dysgonamonadaceae bacterium]|jgi:pantoate--beta-alanine ligase|nr:pantoate--beta-alanine ligase [Dysgonamonadaceae bacterium]
MKTISTIKEIQENLRTCRKENKTIGFVPTMGALHQGHLELVKRCAAENNICVVSIFVNPTQFNDKNDLLKYPHTPDADCDLLKRAGCTYVFIPSVEEMYPEPDTRQFNFGPLEKVMEGAFRPGHFNGVAQIVSKLFDAIMPDKAYFGEKDFQQLTIIREMTRRMNYRIEIIPCPIVRETDGLAMSSRNMRLNNKERQEAALISGTLFESRKLKGQTTVEELKEWVIETINESPGLEVEYFDIVDGNTLQSISSWEDSSFRVGCIAVFCGEVRLIDNVQYDRL